MVESLANVAVGYGVAVVTQMLVFPLFGLSTTLTENIAMGAIFTVVSIARSYCLRRIFEGYHTEYALKAMRPEEFMKCSRDGI